MIEDSSNIRFLKVKYPRIKKLNWRDNLWIEHLRISTKKIIAGAILAPIAVGTASNYNEVQAESEFTTINTVEDFLKIKDNPNGSYLLNNDIDLSGVDWIPFTFTGVLDANGHTIENLTISSNSNYVGLFNRIDSGEVKNLTLKNFEVSGNHYVGALAGEITNRGTIENVQVVNSDVNGTDNVGLLSGRLYHSTLEKSFN